MILDLLTPESQENAYVWAAVMLAHAAIGAAMWAALFRAVKRPLVVVMIAYAFFEAAQAAISGTLLIWDSVLDWCAVGMGAALAAALWRRSAVAARLAALAALVVALVGAFKRR